MSNNSTFLFYDKAVDDNHKFDNKLTINITIENLFLSNDSYLEGTTALAYFNKCFPDKNYAITEDLDFDLYNVYLFEQTYMSAKIITTVIEIKNDKLENIVLNSQQIPNENFLKSVCKFHSLYEKATHGINILDRNYVQNIINQSSEKITTTAMIPNADLSDPIEQQPHFASIPLYDYQKRSSKWMLDRERENHFIYYNKNDEIIMGNVVYDSTIQQFIPASSRQKLVFKGGALIDEVGLGKTYQMIIVSLLNQSKNISYLQDGLNGFCSRATLILCPNQLVGQWTREINKVITSEFGISVVTFFTKNHYDKYTYQDLLDADFVVVSYNFLSNNCFLNDWLPSISSQKSYLTSSKFSRTECKEVLDQMASKLKKSLSSLNNTGANILLINWHRIVVDEIHEVYTNQKMKNVANVLSLFNGSYKWCLTATPFDKSNECLIKMVQYVTGTFETIDEKILKDKNICEYLLKYFFRRNTKKSVKSEYELPPLKEKLIWLNFSKTEWMIYNAYLANPNIDKFSVILRQICCYPKLADEIKEVASTCKSLEDIEKVMVSHYEKQMKKAFAKVCYLEYRIKKVQKRIKILELKRQRTLIKKLGYDVKVEFLNQPILSKQELELLKDQLKEEPDFQELIISDGGEDKNPFDDDDSDDENDNLKKKKKEKPLFTISENNQNEVKKMIEKDLKDVPETIIAQFDIENNFKAKLLLANKEHQGKKATYDYYLDVMNKLKTINETINQNDDDDESLTCAICLGCITKYDSGVTTCGHIYCYNCVTPHIKKIGKCPTCMKALGPNDILQVEAKIPDTKEDAIEAKDKQELISKIGTKLANLIFFLKSSPDHSIIFSQWDELLKKIGDVLDDYGIKNVFCKGNVWQRDKAIREFNTKNDIKVIMLSSESAASGTNLTKAKNVILVDPVHGTYEKMRNTEWQAIGRAYRMGQTQEVNVVRLIIKNTVEEEIYNMNKDYISKAPVETIKFEMNDNEIKLDADKFNEIIDASKQTKKSKSVKTTKTSKLKKEKEKENIDIVEHFSDNADY